MSKKDSSKKEISEGVSLNVCGNSLVELIFILKTAVNDRAFDENTRHAAELILDALGDALS